MTRSLQLPRNNWRSNGKVVVEDCCIHHIIGIFHTMDGKIIIKGWGLCNQQEVTVDRSMPSILSK